MRSPSFETKFIGARLLELCNDVGISLRVLDTLAGRSCGTASQLKRLLRSPGCDLAVDYAVVLGAPLPWLLLGEGPKPRASRVERSVALARRRLADKVRREKRRKKKS